MLKGRDIMATALGIAAALAAAVIFGVPTVTLVY